MLNPQVNPGLKIVFRLFLNIDPLFTGAGTALRTGTKKNSNSFIIVEFMVFNCLLLVAPGYYTYLSKKPSVDYRC